VTVLPHGVPAPGDGGSGGSMLLQAGRSVELLDQLVGMRRTLEEAEVGLHHSGT
jgi:GTPase involved in cell partitioning and DNA repair